MQQVSLGAVLGLTEAGASDQGRMRTGESSSAPTQQTAALDQPADGAFGRVFGRLKEFGEKRAKFKQRKSMHTVTLEQLARHGIRMSPEDLERHNRVGYCIGIAMNWAAERSGAAEPSPVSTDADTTGVHERNGRTVLKAAVGKIAGIADTRQNLRRKTPLHAMLAQFGLDKLDDDRFAGILDPNATETPADEGLARASSEANLGAGETMVAMLTVLPLDGAGDRAGHVVTLHRDADAALYFFEPNAGEYRVRDPSGFFKAWAQAYSDSRHRRLVFASSSLIDGFHRVRPLEDTSESASEADGSDDEATSDVSSRRSSSARGAETPAAGAAEEAPRSNLVSFLELEDSFLDMADSVFDTDESFIDMGSSSEDDSAAAHA